SSTSRRSRAARRSASRSGGCTRSSHTPGAAMGVLLRAHGAGLRHEVALPGGLAVEAAVGLDGVVEGVTVGHQALERDLVVDDELGALGLADAAEGPRAVNRELLVDDVR